MQPFCAEMWIKTLNMLAEKSNVSESDLSPRIGKKVRDFVAEERQPQEIYDFMVEISEEPPHTEISSFVQKLCEVNKYYERPAQ